MVERRNNALPQIRRHPEATRAADRPNWKLPIGHGALAPPPLIGAHPLTTVKSPLCMPRLEPLDEVGPGVTAAGDHPGEQEGMTTSHAC